MKSSNQVHRLPFQTKIVFGFILILTIALASKLAYQTFLANAKASNAGGKFSGIKGQVNDICLKEESKSLKITSEPSEEDQEWITFRAPEYCKCVSSHMLSLWGEKEKLDQIVKINSTDLPGFIVTQLKDENTKSVIDYCLSKAQKISNKKVAADAGKVKTEQ